MAKANPIRWSTKYQDEETDLLYYGYRYYGATTGRWNNRDPLGEKGGANLFCFVQNKTPGAWDFLGLADMVWVDPEIIIEAPHEIPGGFTDWASFEPRTTITKDGCCYRITLSGGRAQPLIVYTEHQWTVLEHELNHVRYHLFPAFADYVEAARVMMEGCWNSRRVACLQEIVHETLAKTYAQRARSEGAQYDCSDYGRNDPSSEACQRSQRESAEYQRQLAQLEEAVKECQRQ